MKQDQALKLLIIQTLPFFCCFIRFIRFYQAIMISQAFLLSLGTLAAASPLLDSRASCTFTDAASAIKGKTSCSAITLSGITVPAGTTLDLTGLKDGTTVTFTGTTTFGYKEWEGPLISVSGKNILVQGASGHIIDGNGAAWWDSKGSNGGKTKPKYAIFNHSFEEQALTTS